jgi:hypothetical protein
MRAHDSRLGEHRHGAKKVAPIAERILEKKPQIEAHFGTNAVGCWLLA